MGSRFVVAPPSSRLSRLLVWVLVALGWVALGWPGFPVCQTASADEAWVPGEILVRPVQEAAAPVLEALSSSRLKVMESDVFSGVLRVAVPVGEEDAWIAALSENGDVVYAERNGIGRGGLIPDDTSFGSQWHLQNTGQFGGTPGADIEAVGAWDITTGSSDILIAVLDTGIDSDHPDFVGRIDPDGMDFVNEDGNPEADHPHGTQVSGVMCANSDNDFGVAGVDWQCRLLPIKVLDQFNAGTTFDLAQGLNYVATQDDVHVVCMSLINYPGNSTLTDALEVASNAGKILIACAGNGGIGNADVSFPGASPLTISIGATNRFDNRAGFSGTGSALDFVAPGDAIVTSAHGTSADTTSTVAGCSFATPITSGVVGLLLARAAALGLPPLDQSAVYALLQAGAEDQVGAANEDSPGPDNFFGEGRINALQSLLALSVPQFIRGDSDGDGVFNALADALHLLGFGFLGGPAPPCLEAADADDDGIQNALADSLYVLTHGFLGGPPPATPYPGCGDDPDSGSSLGCAVSMCP